MATLVRNIPIVNFSVKNLLTVLLFIGVIVGLFFIPEIVNYRSRRGSTIRKESTAPANIVSTQDETQKSPLEDVLERINTGYYSKSDSRAVTGGARSNNAQKIEVAPGKVFGWDTLKSEKGEAALRRAQSVARTLLSSTDQKLFNLRRNLVEFVSGVDYVLGEASKTMSAIDAARFLQNLDLNVARGLLSAGASRADYISWSEVSLADALGNIQNLRAKQQAIKPFNPQLVLQRINLTKVDPAPGSTGKSNSYITFHGSITGKDVKEIILLKNGLRKKTLPLDLVDEEGRQWFSYGTYDVAGDWTIRVVDKLDNLYEKTYRFFPTADFYPREGGSVYQLPYDQEGGDPRTDKLFLIKTVRPNSLENQKYFTTF